MKKVISIGMIFLMILLTFSMFTPQVKAQSYPEDWIRLTTNPHGDGQPDYSPDGKKIAFLRQRSDYWHRDIWIMNADGTNQELLVEDKYGGGVGWPDWSPDGEKIVYAEYRYEHRNDINIVDVNSKEISAVVTDWGPNHTPKWSPDGFKILFNHCEKPFPDPQVWNLYTINTDGTGLKQITYGDRHLGYPDWSPNCSKIVFQQSYDGEKIDIFLMDADGSNEVKLADNGGQPVFFPDGEKILFCRPSLGGYSNLFSINIDSTNEVQLTDCPLDILMNEGTVSPDGREIAFHARPVSELWNWNIYKIILQVTPDFEISVSPSFQIVNPGDSASYTVTLESLGGFNFSVSLSIFQPLPNDTTASFNPSSVTPTGNSTLTITTSSTTPIGAYTITINGTSKGITHLTTATLIVGKVGGVIGEPSFWTQWWFWTITILGITTVAFGASIVLYRQKFHALSKTIERPPPVVPSEKYKVCPKCGAQLPMDSVFCGKCGASLK